MCKKYLKVTISLIFFVFYSTLLHSIGFNNIALMSVKDSYSNYYQITPTSIIGTHVNGIGFNVILGRRFSLYLENKLIACAIGMNFHPTAYQKYYGFEGESIQLNIGTNISLTFGDKRLLKTNPWIIREQSLHTLRYYLSYFLSSDNTSQAYVAMEYKLSLNNSSLKLHAGNDDCIFFQIRGDKFRTTKGLLEYLYFTHKSLYGISLSFNIWTGNTSPLVKPDGFGGEYSHGILALSLIYNSMKVSIGYDSEGIRDTIQNEWHKLRNLQTVPLVDRRELFYIQLSFYPPQFDY